jgi:hypothetical protein
MQVEIYVVMTEINAKNAQLAEIDYECDYNFGDCEQYKKIEAIKSEISQKIGGITVLPMNYGEWWDNGKKIRDEGEIWQILASDDKPIDFQWLKTKIDEIKAVTKQQSQLYTVNRNCVPYYR